MTPGRDTAVGLGLAGLILAAWLCLHVAGVFLTPLSVRSAPLVVLMIGAQTWLSCGLFIVAHDAMHGSLAPRRPRLNAAVGQLMLGLYAGFGFARLCAKHHAHHADPGGAGDPDTDHRPGHRFWPWYVRFFRQYFHPAQAAGIATVAATYILVLHARAENVLLFWATPALLSSLQLFAFGTWLPHRRAEAPFIDRHNARSLEYGWVGSLLACYHFGYHLEHHHAPSAPWWRLPAVRRARAATATEPALFIPR